MRESRSIDSKNYLCLIFDDVYVYIIEDSGYKYFIFALTKNKEKVLRKYDELCYKIKNQVEK